MVVRLVVQPAGSQLLLLPERSFSRSSALQNRNFCRSRKAQVSFAWKAELAAEAGTETRWTCSASVPHYFFDTFDDLSTVRDQAAWSLAELARDVLPASVRRLLVVEVQDGHDPVLEAKLTFETVTEQD